MYTDDLAQQWRERLDDFAQSQMTVREWCDFNQLSPHQYYYWRRKLQAASTAASPPASTAASPPASEQTHWLALPRTALAPTASSGLCVRIAGAQIEVSAGFDPALLRAVVQALGSQPC